MAEQAEGEMIEQPERVANMERRNAVGGMDVDGSDELIDMILIGRKAKTSINPTTFPTSLMRIRSGDTTVAGKHDSAEIVEHNWKHLLAEQDGTVYDYKGRPDVELHVITQQDIVQRERLLATQLSYAKFVPEDNEEKMPQWVSEQTEWKVLFDPVTNAYIMSELVEDCLLVRLRHFRVARLPRELALAKCELAFHTEEYNLLSGHKQRIWRRFVREHLEPLAAHPRRLMNAFYRLTNRVIPSESLYSATDSEAEVKKKPVKKIAKTKTNKAAAPAYNRAKSPGKEKERKGR